MSIVDRLRRVFWIALSAALLGALFGHTQGQGFGDSGLGPYLRGALDGGLAGASISSFELFGLDGARGTAFRQLPFLLHLALRTLAYIAIILVALALGYWLAPFPGEREVVPRRAEVIFSIALSVGYVLYFGVNQLLGPGVLFKFAAGRYHRPRIEERVLLFIDMRSSTAIAERLGEARFLDFLNRFVTDLTLAISAAGGEIHKYVGDEIIATWTVPSGLRSARCITACFDALRRLRAGTYEEDFGFAADFRAGLHCGPVVIGELGLLKMEIALLGDSMNTAARIQQACRDTGHRVLASAALLDRLGALPPGIARRALGPLALRGKEQPLTLYALEEAPPITAVARSA